MTTQQAIIMSNNFAQYAPYKASTKAHQLMWLYLSKVDAFSESPPPVLIPITEIYQFLYTMAQASGRSTTTEMWGGTKKRVKEAVLALQSVSVGILNPDIYPNGGVNHKEARNKQELYEDFYTVFPTIVTDRNAQGELCYKFIPHPKLEHYIFNVIGHNYTKFLLYEETKVTQKHACRLYPALKSRFASQKGRAPLPFYETTVEALRRLLQLEDTEYTKIYDFWRYVVVAAIDDINTNSSLRVDAQQIKQGRKLKKIRFYVSENKHSKAQLKLDVSTVGDKKLQILRKIAKTKAWEIDREEFGSWFPKELTAIKRKAAEALTPYKSEMTDFAYSNQLQGGINNGMREYAIEEVESHSTKK